MMALERTRYGHETIHPFGNSLNVKVIRLQVMPVGFPGGTVVKKLPATAGEARELGLKPGSGRFPGVRNVFLHSSILAWKIPWSEELQGGFHSLVGYSPRGCKELDMTERAHTHTHTHTHVSA